MIILSEPCIFSNKQQALEVHPATHAINLTLFITSQIGFPSSRLRFNLGSLQERNLQVTMATQWHGEIATSGTPTVHTFFLIVPPVLYGVVDAAGGRFILAPQEGHFDEGKV